MSLKQYLMVEGFFTWIPWYLFSYISKIIFKINFLEGKIISECLPVLYTDISKNLLGTPLTCGTCSLTKVDDHGKEFFFKC